MYGKVLEYFITFVDTFQWVPMRSNMLYALLAGCRKLGWKTHPDSNGIPFDT